MNLTFDDWLQNQQNRPDTIGELARLPGLLHPDIKSSRRKVDEHKSWATIIVSIASPGIVQVFNEAWQEFLLASQVAQSPLE
jgi:hypothetical protein